MKNKLVIVLIALLVPVLVIPASVFFNNNEMSTAKAADLTENTNDTTNYFSFTAIDDDVTVRLGSWTPILEFSENKIDWMRIPATFSLEIPANKTYYYRLEEGQEPLYPCGTSLTVVSANGKLAAGGNIMSLVSTDCSQTTIDVSAAFYDFFRNCTCLISAPELPATTLSEGCYSGMFYGCISLVNAPDLPATSLAQYCYSAMFNDCTSLIKAPDLPASNLFLLCYNSMFMGCTSLVDPPKISATTLADECCMLMFCNCASLKSAPILPATELADRCYSSMFRGCIALVSAPELPAKVLATSCYSAMFSFCTSLISAPYLPATALANSCYTVMFSGCSNLKKISVGFSDWNETELATNFWVNGVSENGSFVCPEGLDVSTIDESHVPAGWTVKRSYEIEIENPEHGQISATVADNGNSQIFAEGDNILLSYSSEEGYTLDKWSVKTADGTDVEVVDNCFVMPSENVTITASELAPGVITPTVNTQTGDYTLFIAIALALLSCACVAYNLKKKFK